VAHQVPYDSAAMGEEDLEEVEVEDAAEAFEKGAWCNAAKSSEASSERRPNAAPLALAEKEGTATGASAQFRDNLRLDREKMEELRQEHRSTIDDLHRQLRGKESALAKRQEEVQRHMKALERELQVASLGAQFPAAEHASGADGGSSSAHSTRREGPRFEAGEAVEALHSSGAWCEAVVAEALADGSFLVTWHDHDERERVKPASDLRKTFSLLADGSFLVTKVDEKTSAGRADRDPEKRGRAQKCSVCGLPRKGHICQARGGTIDKMRALHQRMSTGGGYCPETRGSLLGEIHQESRGRKGGGLVAEAGRVATAVPLLPSRAPAGFMERDARPCRSGIWPIVPAGLAVSGRCDKPSVVKDGWHDKWASLRSLLATTSAGEGAQEGDALDRASKEGAFVEETSSVPRTIRDRDVHGQNVCGQYALVTYAGQACTDMPGLRCTALYGTPAQRQMLSKVLVGSTTANGGALTVLARAAQTRDGASTRLKRMPAATWQRLFPKADVRVLTPAEFKEAQAVAWKERWDEGFCQAQPVLAAAAAGAAAREVGNSSDTHAKEAAEEERAAQRPKLSGAKLLFAKGLDIEKLKREVEMRGGFDKVEARQEWRQIARAMDVAPNNTYIAQYLRRQFVAATGSQTQHAETVDFDDMFTRMAGGSAGGAISREQFAAFLHENGRQLLGAEEEEEEELQALLSDMVDEAFQTTAQLSRAQFIAFLSSTSELPFTAAGFQLKHPDVEEAAGQADVAMASMEARNGNSCGNGCEAEDNAPTHWCRECSAAICSFCVATHRRQGHLLSHALTEIALATAAPACAPRPGVEGERAAERVRAAQQCAQTCQASVGQAPAKRQEMYNKVVRVPGEEAAHAFYFVLHYVPDLHWCHLAPLRQDGFFPELTRQGKPHPHMGKKRWRLMPEGASKELDVSGDRCIIVRR